MINNELKKQIEWVDSHFHPQYEPLKIETIQEALDNNIRKLCCVATKLDEIDFLLECKKNFDVAISLGEHPLNDCSNVNWSILEENVKNINAIGEIGFDFQSNIEEQIRIFDIQASLADKYDLPVILHVRDSGNGEIEELTITKIKQFPNLRGIFHCFVGGKKLADFAISQGFFISFSGIITFKKSDQLRDVLPLVPLDLILIETDAPYLAPVPKRGKANHPMYVKYVGEFIADYLNIDHANLAKMVSKNFDMLYHKL